MHGPMRKPNCGWVKVQEWIFRAAQARLQRVADEILCGDRDPDQGGGNICLLSADWALWKHKDHHSFILAALRYSDGEVSTHQWRIPNRQLLEVGPGVSSVRARQLRLDTWVRKHYRVRVRGRAPAAGSPARKSPAHSRPEIGRAHCFRRRDAGTI